MLHAREENEIKRKLSRVEFIPTLLGLSWFDIPIRCELSHKFACIKHFYNELFGWASKRSFPKWYRILNVLVVWKTWFSLKDNAIPSIHRYQLLLYLKVETLSRLENKQKTSERRSEIGFPNGATCCAMFASSKNCWLSSRGFIKF